MTDQIDTASELEQAHRDEAIRRAAIQDRNPRGTCYNCNALIPGPLLYCDQDCADDHRLRLHQRGPA